LILSLRDALIARSPADMSTVPSFKTRLGVRRPALFLTAVLVVCCTAARIGAQRTVFRSTVDVIAVDVQVVDADGNPVGQIGPEAFEVSINGQRRKVQSAQFLRHMSPPARPDAPAAAPSSGDEREAEGRTIILAVDAGSFEVGSERASIEAAQRFVEHLNPSDRVGLFVYPTGAKISPTTSRAVLRVNLERVLGQRDPLRSHYNLRPWEIVDITAQSTNPNSFLSAERNRNATTDTATTLALDPVLKVQARECPIDPDCPAKIYAEGMGLATQLERQVQMSVSGFETLLRALAEVPGRKAVILVSAGFVVSDRLDGRPDVGSLARILGQEAARANANVYTVHIDTTRSGFGLASQQGVTSANAARDRSLMSNWLNEFSDSSGGKLLYVPNGSGDFAFDRVLRETSAYYLLGVEPALADRDGKPRQLQVKVHRRGVSVRSRQWVVIPAKS
jgi:VWFA-related protein